MIYSFVILKLLIFVQAATDCNVYGSTAALNNPFLTDLPEPTPLLLDTATAPIQAKLTNNSANIQNSVSLNLENSIQMQPNPIPVNPIPIKSNPVTTNQNSVVLNQIPIEMNQNPMVDQIPMKPTSPIVQNQVSPNENPISVKQIPSPTSFQVNMQNQISEPVIDLFDPNDSDMKDSSITSLVQSFEKLEIFGGGGDVVQDVKTPSPIKNKDEELLPMTNLFTEDLSKPVSKPKTVPPRPPPPVLKPQTVPKENAQIPDPVTATTDINQMIQLVDGAQMNLPMVLPVQNENQFTGD